jgi:hypothetical protein
MTILKTAEGNDQHQCDGCGRVDAGPGASLSVKEYVVNDPNIGSKVAHHYCAGCAANRNAEVEELNFGWGAVAPVVEAMPEVEQQPDVLDAVVPADA